MRILSKYRSLFLGLFLLSVVAKGQTYNPSVCCTVSNKSYGSPQAVSTDGRSWFYDATNFVMRDYNGTTEVFSYLNLPKYRSGHFPIFVHSGGILQTNGVWLGGTTLVYWFKDSTGNANLVRWYTDSTGTPGGPFFAVANNLSEGNAGLIKGTLTLDLVNNTSDAQKNAAAVSLTNHTINGSLNTLTNIPNSALTNKTIGLTLNNAGATPQVSTTPAALGASLVLSVPWNNGSDSGFLKGTDWTAFHNKNDSATISNDTLYNWVNGMRTFQSVVAGTGGVNSVNGTNPSLLFSPSTGNVLGQVNPAFGFNWTAQHTFTSFAPIFSTLTTNGGLFYGNGSGQLLQTGAGTSTQILQSNGGGAPSFFTPDAATIAGWLGYTPLSRSLASAHILVGNGSNIATDVAASGDWTINNAGVNVIGANKISYAKIQSAVGQGLMGATGAGNFGLITLGNNLSMTGSVLNVVPDAYQIKRIAVTGLTGITTAGDSYTTGYNAPDINKIYPRQLRDSLSLTLNNVAVNAAGLYNILNQILTQNYTARTDLVTILGGGLDAISNGATQVTQTKTFNLSKSILANCLMTTVVSASNSGSVTASGFTGITSASVSTISRSQNISSSNIMRSVASGSTLSYTFTADNIILGTYASTATNLIGGFSVSIDGSVMTTYNGSETVAGIGTYAVAGESGVYLYPNAIIIRGLSSGSHTIVLTTTSTSPTYVDYFGFMPATTAAKPILFSDVAHYDVNVSFPIYSLPVMPNINKYADILSREIHRAINIFNGYPVASVGVNNFYSPYQDVLRPDNLHPNQDGQNNLYSAFDFYIDNTVTASFAYGAPNEYNPLEVNADVTAGFIQNQTAVTQTASFKISGTATASNLEIGQRGFSSSPSLFATNYISYISNQGHLIEQGDTATAKFPYVQLSPAVLTTVPYAGYKSRASGLIQAFNLFPTYSPNAPFYIITEGLSNNGAGDIILQPGSTYSSFNSLTTQVGNFDIYLNPAGTGTVRTPNIISKNFDTTTYKLKVVNSSGQEYKMAWPTYARIDAANIFTGVQTFSSSPVMPTPAAHDSTTKGATTLYVDRAVNEIAAYGTFVPTVGTGTNVSATSLTSAFFWRTGNIMHAKINGSVTITLGATNSDFTVTVPTNSAGTINGAATGFVGPTTTDKIGILGNQTSVSTITCYFTSKTSTGATQFSITIDYPL